jgi:RecA-family ATPase
VALTEPLSQLATLIEPVARILLGEPNRGLSSKGELRYGARGSMAIDLRKGTWFDHEANVGGGTLDLIERQTGLREAERFEWLTRNTDYQDEAKTNGHDRATKLGRVVAAYPYIDEAGEFLFEVVRFDPKDFRQRRRARSDDDPTKIHDGWIWSVSGIRPVPYRLPEVIEAAANERTIFIPEGEKDCDSLWRLGLPATTNAGGAGKWRSELNRFFAGADVVIIPDNDPQKTHPKTKEPMFHPDGRPILPGQDHASDVARQLTGVARRVRVLELWRSWPQMPLKGDVSNWIDAGGTPDQIYALTDELPDWSPSQPPAQAPAVKLALIEITRWDGQPVPDRKWTVLHRIPAKNVTLVSGEGGVGKTLLMLQLAVATVLGRDWIGAMPEPGPVIFITAEDDEDELHFRLSKIVEFYGTSFRQLGDLHLMSLAGKDAVMGNIDAKGIVKRTQLFESLRASAEAIRPQWIGIDTAADVFIVDERNRSQVRQCISLLRGMALDFNTAVVLLSHPSLTGISSGSGLSGSTAWNNSVRSRLYLKSPKKGEDDDEEVQSAVRVLEIMKANYGPIGEPVRLIWKDGLLRIEPGPTSMERVKQDAEAQNIFLALLERYTKQDMTVSCEPTARNFAPRIFATLPEAKALDKSESKRKQLLRQAMEYLLTKDRIFVGKGPRGVAPSKQKPCLHTGGLLL